MDPDIVEQLNEQFREMSDILSQQNSLMAAQVRNMRGFDAGINGNSGALKSNTSETDKNTESTRELTAQQTKHRDHIQKMDSVIGVVTNSLGGFASALMDTTQSMSKYGDAVGKFGDTVAGWGKESDNVFGYILGQFTKIATFGVQEELKRQENTLKFSDTLAKMGAVNQFSTEELAKMGETVGLTRATLDRMIEPVKKLGSTFQAIGVGTADSMRKYTEIMNVTEEQRREMARMGYVTDEERFEAQGKFLESVTASGMSLRTLAKDTDSLRKQTIDYLSHLSVLADITGQSVEEVEKQRKEAAATVQFQLWAREQTLKAIELEKAGDQAGAARINKKVQDAMSIIHLIEQTGGKTMKAALSEEIATGQLTTIGDALGQMSIQGTMDDYLSLARKIREGTATLEDAIVMQNKQIEGTNRPALEYGSVLAMSGTEEFRKLTGTDDYSLLERQSMLMGMTKAERLALLKASEEAAETNKATDKDGKPKDATGKGADDPYQTLRSDLLLLERQVQNTAESFMREIGLLGMAFVGLTAAAGTAAVALAASSMGGKLLGRLGLGGLATLATGAGAGGGVAAAGGAAVAGGSAAAVGGAVAAGKGMFKTPGGILLDPKQAEAYNALQQQKAEALAEQDGKKSRFGKIGDRLSAAGGKLGKFGKIGGGIGGLLGGFALDAGADMATEAGYTKTGGALSAGSYAATGAGLGAMLGLPGALAGGIIGGGYGLYQNWDKITGKTSTDTKEANDNSLVSNSSFDKSVQIFGSLITSYGRMVTAFGKIVGAFGNNIKSFSSIIRNLNRKLDNLGKLSVKNTETGVNRNSAPVEERFIGSVSAFGSIVASFGRIVTAHGKLVKAFGGKLLNAGSSALNAPTFGLLGTSAEDIAKAAKKKTGDATSPASTDSDFTKSVQTFGKLVTSFGRIVTAHGKLVKAFGTNVKAFNIVIKNLNKKISQLSKLSIKPAARELGRRTTSSPEEIFSNSVKLFGDYITNFGKIMSVLDPVAKSSTDPYGKKLSQFDKFGINRDNKNINDIDEEEDLIDYIQKLKNEFKETTKIIENHREEAIISHNFTEMSMLKFRTNLDIITDQFQTLSQSPMFSSMLGDGYGAPGGGGGGGGVNNTVLDAIAKAEGTYESGYNTSLGYGKYLPGGKEHNLTEMTLEQVHELGKFMRKQAGNPNSSALGRYQILATSTMLDAAKALKMDLKTTKFDEQTQDKMAMWIAKQQGLGAWQGFNKHPELKQQAQTALDSGNYGGGSGPRLGNADSKAIADLGKYLEKTYGVEASRHSAFNQDGKRTTSGHSPNSKHYKDLAIDINAPGGIREWDDKKWRGVFDRIAADVESKGFKVIWGNKDHKDHIHIETPKIKAAQGGVFDGPSSGYPAELHGSEMVAPLDTNSILMKLATTPASSNTEEMNVTTSLREKETVEKITMQTRETMSELIDKVTDLINAVEDGNDVRRKMLINSMQ